MIGVQARTEFYPQRIERAIDRAAFRNMGHAAASIRKTAIASIHFTREIIGYITVTTRTGKKVRRRIYRPSPPGTPVYGHVNRAFFRRAIRFDYDRKTQEAVVGPTYSILGDVMRVHEFGGTRKLQTYPPRPVIVPALEDNVDRFADSWRGSIGE